MGADMVAEFPGRLQGGDDQRYGQPTPGAGASTTSTSPVLVLMTFSMLSVPRQSAVSMNSIRRSGPPSMVAKHGRPRSICSSTSPPSRIRAQSFAMFALEAQMQPSASRQMPSGPTPSAQTRRFDVEGGEACGKGLGDDERLVVR